MTTPLRTALRQRAVPILLAVAATTAAVLFRAELRAWFTGQPVGDSSSPPVTVDTGAVALDVSVRPDPPRQGRNALVIRVRDASGNPVTGAHVTASVWMPAMGSMPEMRSEGRVVEQGGGTYRADFDLAMGGTWTVDVAAHTPAGTAQAEFTLTVGTPGLVEVHHGGASGGAPGSGRAMPAHRYGDAARASLREALAAYEAVRSALAHDTTDGVASAAARAAAALRAAEAAAGDAPDGLRAHLRDAAAAADALARAGDLAAARAQFAAVSEHLVAAVSADPAVRDGLHLYECSMATDYYNRWLQPDTSIENPYQGQKMSTCGAEVRADEGGRHAHAAAAGDDDVAYYTCPMDTWVESRKPGKCPVCGMDLIPVTHEELRTGVLRIDHRRRQLIGLRTGLVERRDLTVKVRAVGRVTYDERRLSDVTLKVGGWIERLMVNTTGQRVRRGQVLFTIYSPELYSAQQDLLLAVAARAAANGGAAADRAAALERAARRRLRLWDLTDDQIDAIAAAGEPLEQVPIRSPASGYVVDKAVVEGAAVQPGQRVYRIAALDRVWVEADIYEQDIPFVSVGQRALVTLTHLPGRTFEGTIAYVYPYLDRATRTARVRIELPNDGLLLRPDMYADVTVERHIGERLVVPEAAVIYSGPRRIVFVDVDRERLRPVPIQVGIKTDGLFEV
ncbi:MAG: efflux RND transporter periplasmic adaptor subunit, partial [Deltaproteobacteria bacterium]